MFRILSITCLLGCFGAGLAHTDDTWPQFRGPSARGSSEDKALPDSWSTSKNVAWKADVPGRAWSSPIVWGNRVFLTTVVSAGKVEDARKGLYFGGERQAPKDEHRWLVLCFDARSGQKLWEKTANTGVPRAGVHIKNSHASETPVTDGKQVYAYFGNVGVFCYDFDGNLKWEKRLDSHRTRFGWGTAASPVLHRDRLYLVNDNEEKSYLLALDAATGKEVFRIDRQEKSNWATPFIWETPQRTELVTCGSGKVRSYDLQGKLLWEMSGMSTIAIPTPVAGNGMLFISSGYVMDKLRPLYAIRPGAMGDITLKEGESENSAIAWSHKLGGPYNPSPILYGDYLYVLYDRGLMACYEARTGKLVYEKQRLGSSSAFTTSPWAYNGKIFCLDEDGETHVIQAGPEFKLLGSNKLDEMALATPALVDHALFIRTMSHLYRIQSSP